MRTQSLAAESVVRKNLGDKTIPSRLRPDTKSRPRPGDCRMLESLPLLTGSLGAVEALEEPFQRHFERLPNSEYLKVGDHSVLILDPRDSTRIKVDASSL